jgi:hypothetical protein
VTPAVAVRASCALCNADLQIGEILRVNGRHLLVVQPCSNPKCKVGPASVATGQKKR